MSRWRIRRGDTLSVRLAFLYVAATLPLTIIAAYLGPLALVTISWGAGLVVTAFGSSMLVSRPLRRLLERVGEWRAGAVMAQAGDMPDELYPPREIRRLSIVFRRATLVLRRQQARLSAAKDQQELLMQEIHHRVKNNLQIVASLLNLQASRIRVPEARAEFQSARDRVRALATLHRHLYAHGEVHTIDMREFLIELCGQLFAAMGEKAGERLALHIEAPELKMSSDQAVPMALIVTEAVTNAVKYAFPGGRRGSISVQLTADTERAELEIRDDGVGIPAGRVETEAGTRDGIGIQLIRGFARQLGATLTVEEGNGTRYKVVMPLRQTRVVGPVLGALVGKAGVGKAGVAKAGVAKVGLGEAGTGIAGIGKAGS